MMTMFKLGLLTFLAAACGNDGAAVDPPLDAPLDRSTLETCVIGGGAVKELWSTSNQHGAVTSIAVGGTTIVLGSIDGSVKIWRADGTSPSYGLPFLGETGIVVDALAFASDGTVLGGDQNAQLSEWRLADSETMRTTTIGTVGLKIVAVSETARLAAVASGAKLPDIRMVDRVTGTVSAPLDTRLWGVRSIAFGHGHVLLTAGHNYGTPMIERRSTEDPSAVIEYWNDMSKFMHVTAIAVDPYVIKLVAGGDGFVAVLDPKALSAGAIFTPVPEHDVVGIALLPGNQVFVTVGKEGSLRTWSAVTGAPLGMLPIAQPIGLGVDHTGERLFTAGPDGNLRAFGCE